jgi:outer membrane protein assembly factor BamD
LQIFHHHIRFKSNDNITFAAMFKKRIFISIILISSILLSCSKHQKLLKSTDNEKKYEIAMQYYDKGDFYRALQLFDQLIPIYRGTSKSEDLLFRYPFAYFNQRDYVMASYHFNRFSSTFPLSSKAEEAAYMAAYCKYLESPRHTLDQTVTKDAINEFQSFINRYPYGEKAKEATKLIDQLRLKLQKKDYNIANLYMKIGDYQAAIVSFRNLLKDYPEIAYKEEIMYKIVVSAYNFANNSIQEKKQERLESAQNDYYDFITLFPESRYVNELNKYYKRSIDQPKKGSDNI